MDGFLGALLKRRSIYGISKEIPISDGELKELLGTIIKNMPTAYNMQNTRTVLLLGADNAALWSIVLEALRAVASPDGFARTEAKIAGFAAGHGTILYFVDEAVKQKYMDDNPLYAENFPPWQLQHGGMLQFAVWTALAERGIGASLQHYNPLIDEQLRKQWDLPEEWTLLAQMPFGSITQGPREKTFEPLENRFKVFGEK